MVSSCWEQSQCWCQYGFVLLISKVQGPSPENFDIIYKKQNGGTHTYLTQ